MGSNGCGDNYVMNSVICNLTNVAYVIYSGHMGWSVYVVATIKLNACKILAGKPLWKEGMWEAEV